MQLNNVTIHLVIIHPEKRAKSSPETSFNTKIDAR